MKILIDKNLQYQNPLKSYDIALIVLDVFRNTYETIAPLRSEIIAAVASSDKERPR